MSNQEINLKYGIQLHVSVYMYMKFSSSGFQTYGWRWNRYSQMIVNPRSDVVLSATSPQSSYSSTAAYIVSTVHTECDDAPN
jgi:hypothetical protein